jgi:excisionase family DNA binding protein
LIAKVPEELYEKGDEVLTSAEVAELLKVHLSSVRRWSRSGKLKGYRLGGYGDWRFMRKDVLAFLYSHGNGKGGGDGIAEGGK